MSECRKVQVERPSSSVLGGQSVGVGVEVWSARVVEDVDDVLEGADLACLVSARHDAAEVQRRHLASEMEC